MFILELLFQCTFIYNFGGDSVCQVLGFINPTWAEFTAGSNYLSSHEIRRLGFDFFFVFIIFFNVSGTDAHSVSFFSSSVNNFVFWWVCAPVSVCLCEGCCMNARRYREKPTMCSTFYSVSCALVCTFPRYIFYREIPSKCLFKRQTPLVGAWEGGGPGECEIYHRFYSLRVMSEIFSRIFLIVTLLCSIPSQLR